MTDNFKARLAARLAPPDNEVFAKLGYRPTAFQQRAHDAQEWDLFVGGAAGSGKSLYLTMEGIRACARYPGFIATAYRRSYPELQESFVTELRTFGFCEAIGATWNASEHDLRFANGSVFRLRYADTLDDASRRLGSSTQLLLIDELTTMDPDVIDLLVTRLRSANPSIPVLGIRSASNPGGRGHAAVFEKYIAATAFGKNVVTDERGRTLRYLPATVKDNPHVGAEYEITLQSISDPILRRAMLDGDWTVVAGAAFQDFRRERVLVPWSDLRELPLYCGVDWGYAAPWAVEYVAYDRGDQRAYVVGELYARQVGESEQAQRMLEWEQGWPEPLRFGDPAMWARRGDADSLDVAYEREGVFLEKGNNSRLHGWSRVHQFLAEAPACPHHRAMCWDTCPRLHILDGVAPNLVRTLPTLPRDPVRPEDVDSRGDDHAADALRMCLLEVDALIQPTLVTGVPGLEEAIRRERLELGTEIPGRRIGGFVVVDPHADVLGMPWGGW